MAKIWLRLGITVYGIKEEIDALVNAYENGTQDAETILQGIIQDGKYEPEGDWYIPEECLEEYHNTND